MNILIPIAKSSKKIKSCYHRSLIKINKQQTLLEYQLQTLAKVDKPTSVYLLVEEYQDEINEICERYSDNCPINQTVTIIRATSDCLSQSIKDAFELMLQKECILVMGDIIFNKAAIKSLFKRKTSTFLTDSRNFFAKNEIGVWHQDNMLRQFGYSLPVKWVQMCYLNEEFVRNYVSFFKKNLLPHEIFNSVLEISSAKVISPNRAKAVEIDKPKDVRLARQVFL